MHVHVKLWRLQISNKFRGSSSFEYNHHYIVTFKTLTLIHLTVVKTEKCLKLRIFKKNNVKHKQRPVKFGIEDEGNKDLNVKEMTSDKGVVERVEALMRPLLLR